jgi:hypothetical protein
MTDEELVKRLRDKHCCESPNCNCDEVADRIEALINLNEALVELMDDRDAKLAKAVEALKEALYFLKPTESDMEKRAGIYRIVTTLAEIEGEKG